jgi:hypothetical protein
LNEPELVFAVARGNSVELAATVKAPCAVIFPKLPVITRSLSPGARPSGTMMVKLSADWLEIETDTPSIVQDVTRFSLGPDMVTSPPIEGFLSE